MFALLFSIMFCSPRPQVINDSCAKGEFVETSKPNSVVKIIDITVGSNPAGYLVYGDGENSASDALGTRGGKFHKYKIKRRVSAQFQFIALPPKEGEVNSKKKLQDYKIKVFTRHNVFKYGLTGSFHIELFYNGGYIKIPVRSPGVKLYQSIIKEVDLKGISDEQYKSFRGVYFNYPTKYYFNIKDRIEKLYCTEESDFFMPVQGQPNDSRCIDPMLTFVHTIYFDKSTLPLTMLPLYYAEHQEVKNDQDLESLAKRLTHFDKVMDIAPEAGDRLIKAAKGTGNLEQIKLAINAKHLQLIKKNIGDALAEAAAMSKLSHADAEGQTMGLLSYWSKLLDKNLHLWQKSHFSAVYDIFAKYGPGTENNKIAQLVKQSIQKHLKIDQGNCEKVDPFTIVQTITKKTIPYRVCLEDGNFVELGFIAKIDPSDIGITDAMSEAEKERRLYKEYLLREFVLHYKEIARVYLRLLRDAQTSPEKDFSVVSNWTYGFEEKALDESVETKEKYLYSFNNGFPLGSNGEYLVFNKSKISNPLLIFSRYRYSGLGTKKDGLYFKDQLMHLHPSKRLGGQLTQPLQQGSTMAFRGLPFSLMSFLDDMMTEGAAIIIPPHQNPDYAGDSKGVSPDEALNAFVNNQLDEELSEKKQADTPGGAASVGNMQGAMENTPNDDLGEATEVNLPPMASAEMYTESDGNSGESVPVPDEIESGEVNSSEKPGLIVIGTGDDNLKGDGGILDSDVEGGSSSGNEAQGKPYIIGPSGESEYEVQESAERGSGC